MNRAYTFVLALTVFVFRSLGQTNITVTSLGAIGDARSITVNCVSNSTTVTVASGGTFTSSDVGKLCEIFSGGPVTSPSNHMDFIGVISSVSGGTSLVLTSSPSITSNGLLAVVGTNNAVPFQRSIDYAGNNGVINIPDGRYLLVSSNELSSVYTMPNAFTVTESCLITNGGLRIVGASTNAVLLGNGAWLLKGSYVQRGMMFHMRGPVLDNGTLSFENLTFDGGVQAGRTSVDTFPARTYDGDGWDVTHGAMFTDGPSLQRLTVITNCYFSKWRGEVLKSSAANYDETNVLTDCSFTDNNASALNFSFTYRVTNCIFSKLQMAMEWYSGYSQGDSYFMNCSVSNMTTGFVLVGALTNNTRPTVTFKGNTIKGNGSSTGFQLSPMKRMTVVSNTIMDCFSGVAVTAAGYQGTDDNGQIVISGNTFSNSFRVFSCNGDGDNRLDGLVCSNNSIAVVQFPFFGSGWGSNMFLYGNTVTSVTGGGDGTVFNDSLTGQWYFDDLSNNFPYHSTTSTSANTNIFGYTRGARHNIYCSVSGSKFVLDNSSPSKIPKGAIVIVRNIGPTSIALYGSSSAFPSGYSSTLYSGISTKLYWSGTQWTKPPAITNITVQPMLN